MKVALAFTGGLDSYIAYRMAITDRRDVVPYHVDFGQSYALWERQAARELQVPTQLLTIGNGNKTLLELPTYWLGGADQSDIVPGRNLLLAVLGANLGDTVWICAVRGEMHPYSNRDKSHEWYHQTSAALTYSWLPVRPETKVVAPLGHFTKRQAVRFALKELNVRPDELRQTWTCYRSTPTWDRGHRLPCGECGACFHRWVAMSLNGIDEKHAVRPWTSQRARDEILAMLREEANPPAVPKYDPQRVYETREAMARKGAAHDVAHQ